MDRQILPQETELQYWQDRAVYLEAENDRLRAGNVVLAESLKELETQIEALTARVLKLTQQVYGRKSEQQAAKPDSADSLHVCE